METLPSAPLQSFPSFVKRVGLAQLQEEKFLETEDELVKRVLPELGITNKNVIKNMLTLSLYVHRKRWLAFLALLSENGVIGKRQLLSMYRLQAEGIRRERPILFVKDLHMLTKNGERIFSDKEIITLVGKRIAIHESDIEFLMADEAIRENLPVDLLKNWVDGEEVGDLSILCRARIAERLSRKKKDVLSLETLCEAFSEAGIIDPHSDAIPIFFTLLYSHKDIRSARGKDKAREALFRVICHMVLPLTRRSVNVEGGRKLLGWYLTNPLISSKDKVWMEEQITAHTKVIAEYYGTFIQSAKTSSITWTNN